MKGRMSVCVRKLSFGVMLPHDNIALQTGLSLPIPAFSSTLTSELI